MNNQIQTGVNMTGAIFYSGQYGSTAQYAEWIGEAAGLPAFDVNGHHLDPSAFDFLILGSSVIMYKLTIGKWTAKHLEALLSRPTCLYTVSGAPAGPQLDGWVKGSFAPELITHLDCFGMMGRLDVKSVSLWHRIALRIGAWQNDDPKSKEEELHGYDYMDKASIAPVLEWAGQYVSAAGGDS